MTLKEIINQKDWWHLKDKNYIMDDGWINEYKQPSPYSSFIWWNQYTFKTPRLYFRIVVREHTEEALSRICKSVIGKYIYKHKYTVIIMGAISGVPLPLEIWEETENPWKSGINPYIDCFYFGRKYKDLETDYIGKQVGTSSTLIKAFDYLDEANEFVEMWKVKLIEDHKEEITLDKEIIKLIS